VLQSTPDPIPTTFGECGRADNVQIALERAVDCTDEPSAYRTTLTSGERACLDNAGSPACETYCTNNMSEAWCESDGGDVTFLADPFKRALFPPGDAYRDIPLVLRRQDYLSDGNVDKEALRADFACMSFVGTSGWSFEKGLGAAQAATHPDMVGSYYDPDAREAPADKPNYGLIRKDADFSVIFVTDENDCTYDNDRNETISDALQITEVGSQCGDDACAFANSTQVDPSESPLIPTSEIAARIVEQLATIKESDFSSDRVVAASIHGQPNRYDGPVRSAAECGADGYEGIGPTCSSPLGTAYSGDRYQRFVETFGEGQHFPDTDDPDINTDAQICIEEGFGGPLAKIAELIVGRTKVCITADVYPCAESAQCPLSADLEAEGVQRSCEQFAQTGDMYCRNAIQLVMRPPSDAADPEQLLRQTDYCFPGTVGLPELDGGCIVDHDRYVLRTCAANDLGLTVEWTDDAARETIGDFEVDVRYAVSSDTRTVNMR
jgi:hypothetical protein